MTDVFAVTQKHENCVCVWTKMALLVYTIIYIFGIYIDDSKRSSDVKTELQRRAQN